MISKILNREHLKPLMDYVLKEDSKILKFGNVLQIGDQTKHLFETTMTHLSLLNETKNKFVHIPISLTKEDIVSDEKFIDISENYLNKMGFNNQPYLIVRHFDSANPHVHIITTRVKENTKLIDSKNDRWKNKKVARSIEKEFGLSVVSNIKVKGNIKKFRTTKEYKFETDAGSQKKYIKDCINFIVGNYNITSFNTFIALLKEYEVKAHINETKTGKKGISFQIITKDSSLKSEFINPTIPGNRIYSNYTYPKLNDNFKKNEKAKANLKNKYRLKHSMISLFKSFENIEINDFPLIIKNIKGIEVEIVKSKSNILGYRVYDKSKYIYNSSEIDKSLTFNNELFSTEKKTKLSYNSNELKNIVKRELKKQITSFYLRSNKNKSSLLDFYKSKIDLPSKQIIDKSEKLTFLSKIENDKNKFSKYLETLKKDLINELIKEEQYKIKDEFNNKVRIIRELNNEKINIHLLTDSLNVKYKQLNISDNNGNYIKINNQDIKYNTSKYREISKYEKGFSISNYFCLKNIIFNEEEYSTHSNFSYLYLQKIYPDIYSNLNSELKNRYNRIALTSYFNYMNSLPSEDEESAIDYLKKANTKGFYFIKKDDELFMKSIYTSKTEIKVNDNIKEYLNNNLKQNEIDEQIQMFDKHLESINIDSLWLTDLIERKNYEKAAYLMKFENLKPLLTEKSLEFHLNSGLKEQFAKVSKYKKSQIKNSVKYSFRSYSNSKKQEFENYNSFIDEFTDKEKNKILNI